MTTKNTGNCYQQSNNKNNNNNNNHAVNQISTVEKEQSKSNQTTKEDQQSSVIENTAPYPQNDDPTNVAKLSIPVLSEEHKTKYPNFLSQDITFLPPTPYLQFDLWYRRSLQRHDKNPWAHNFVLSTANCQCNQGDFEPKPHNCTPVVHARTVSLYRHFKVDSEKNEPEKLCFVFCSNHDGPKAHQMKHNSNAAMTFQWVHMSQQIRVEGTVKKMTPEETEPYYRSRGVPPSNQAYFYATSQGSQHPYNQSNRIHSKTKALEYVHSVTEHYQEIISAPDPKEDEPYDEFDHSQYEKKSTGDAPQVPLGPAWGGYVLTATVVEFLAIVTFPPDRIRYSLQNNGWVVERLMP